jgi:hypothetical protein
VASYSFTYTDALGGLIRLSAMQCESDAEAISAAHVTMRDDYAELEILSGARLVYCRAPANLGNRLHSAEI